MNMSDPTSRWIPAAQLDRLNRQETRTFTRERSSHIERQLKIVFGETSAPALHLLSHLLHEAPEFGAGSHLIDIIVLPFAIVVPCHFDDHRWLVRHSSST